MEIVVSYYNEDLEWLDKSPWPIVLVEHEGSNPWTLRNVKERYAIPNHGNEATAYLKYIIERYYTLPDYVAFIHGHENAWHQKGDRPLLNLIRDANLSKYNYIPLNNHWMTQLHQIDLDLLNKHWNEYMPIELPHNYQCHVCAQFIVSRDAIQNTSRERYIELYDMVMRGDSKKNAVVIEHIWHWLFGQPLQMEPYSDYFTPPIKEYVFMHP